MQMAAIFKSIVPTRSRWRSSEWIDERGFAVEGQNGEFVERIEAGVQPLVAIELIEPRPVPAHETDPAVERFLGGDDTRESVGMVCHDSGLQAEPDFGTFAQFAEMIGVENDEHRHLLEMESTGIVHWP